MHSVVSHYIYMFCFISPWLNPISPHHPGRFIEDSWLLGFITLTGWWLSHPSEKYESQLGLLCPTYGKIKFMFQTTNQLISWKITILMGKSTINAHFSIAILNFQRVVGNPHFDREQPFSLSHLPYIEAKSTTFSSDTAFLSSIVDTLKIPICLPLCSDEFHCDFLPFPYFLLEFCPKTSRKPHKKRSRRAWPHAAVSAAVSASPKPKCSNSPQLRGRTAKARDMTMIYGYLWWFKMVYGDLWWFMVIYGYLWWFIMVYGDLKWFMVI